MGFPDHKELILRALGAASSLGPCYCFANLAKSTIFKSTCFHSHQRIDAFELWCWRRLLRVPWTARRSNQFILKKISPGCSLEGLMLKLKLQYQYSCLENPYGQRSLVGYSLWGCKESDTTEQLSTEQQQMLSHSVMSDSLQPHDLQPTRLLCP